MTLRTAGDWSIPDEVILPALRLARRDRERGGLTAQDETFILDSAERCSPN